jgi:predicted RNase H-like nuclease (RuvC/YqgF family)
MALQAALHEKKRGRKPKKTSEEKEINQLKKRVATLEKQLHQAEMIIEVQKKISDLLGIHQPPIENGEHD